MLSIHFTADDLARTYVSPAADPLWEMVLSRLRLDERHRPLQFRLWTREVLADPAKAARIRSGAQWLATLAPLGPYFPDFVTPAEASDGLEAGLEAIRRTPRRRLRHELRQFAKYSHSPVPGWVGPLADGHVPLLEQLCDALRAYHRVAIAPHHDLVQAAVDADRARRARGMLDGGVEGLLASLRPIMRWRPPVLEVDYDIDRELHLDGRGLRLVPSFFCTGAPVSLADPGLAPVLIYPIDQECRWSQSAVGTRPLQALMGATRANVLDAVGSGGTTTQLARRLKTSPASISRHTAVLRDAGLITTHRHGAAVLHTCTPLGVALLRHRLRDAADSG